MIPQTRDFIRRTLEWFRQGYPDGLQSGDYVALLGVLRRRLTDSEIEEIALDLAAEDDNITPDDIRRIAREYFLQEPRKKDVGRVVDALSDDGVQVFKDGEPRGE